MNDDPVPVTDALDGLLRSLRGGAGRAEVGGVFGRWEEAVGQALAANVRPVRLEHGTLLVEVDDPAWATQVRYLADDITARLAEVTGVTVERIDVRVPPPPGDARPPPAGPTPGSRRSAALRHPLGRLNPIADTLATGPLDPDEGLPADGVNAPQATCPP